MTQKQVAVTTSRDYIDEMRALIDLYRKEEGYNAAVAAHNIASRLAREDPDLLHGYMSLHAVSTIRSAMQAIDASTRSYARSHSAASVFAEAAAEHEAGNPEPIQQGFLQAVYVVNGSNDRKRLSQMHREDVMYVVERYEERSKTAAMQAAFLKAVARTIGDGTVGEAWNNVQLAELYETITGKRTS